MSKVTKETLRKHSRRQTDRRRELRKASGKAKPHQGRKTLLTPQLSHDICTSMEMGNYPEIAALANGISVATLYGWLKKGTEEKREPYLSFAENFKKAEATAEQSAVIHIRAQMPKNWTAAMTFLERRHRTRWGRFETQIVQNPDGSAVDTAPKVHIYMPDNGRDAVDPEGMPE